MKKKKLSIKQKEQMSTSRLKRADNFSCVKEGVIIVHQGKTLQCLTQNGQNYKIFFNKAFTPNVGDKIRFGVLNEGQGQIIEIKKRKNLLYRETLSGLRKELAANIDRAFVMLAVEPSFYPEVLSQYLTLLNIQNIQCCFLLNKTDLVKEGAYPYQERFDYFEKKGLAKVFYTSCLKKSGIERIQELLFEKTSIFIGPSGVGKSSLVKAITDQAEIVIGDLSEAGFGRHTTSVTRMYSLSQEKTFLIDAPGIRQLALEKITKQELHLGFPDLKEFSCRFKDCDHLTSLGCAIKEDSINKTHFRYHDYCFLYNKFIGP
jgi:ribosome biogenesis GTPase